MGLFTSAWPGVMRIGRFWQISSCTIRGILLRDGFVMAAAGMHPPRVILAEGRTKSSKYE